MSDFTDIRTSGSPAATDLLAAGSIPSRWRQQVQAHAGRLAVRDGDTALTYAALDALAGRVAGTLVARCGPGSSPVATLLPQGWRAVVAILGILRAGKFYVSLEPHHPPDRTGTLLEDAGAALIVTDRSNLDTVRAAFGRGRVVLVVEEMTAQPVPATDAAIAPHDPAYLFYTSGTTGSPKGVVDTHVNVLHNVYRYTSTLGITADDRLSLLQSTSFSGSVSSLFSALLNGASIHPFRAREASARDLARWVREEGITIYHSVPSLFQRLAEAPAAGDRARADEAAGFPFPSVRIIRLEGDQASRRHVELYRRRFGPTCILVNGLGTTETGLVSQFFVDHDTPIEGEILPVGHAVRDMEVGLLDEAGAFDPALRAGELGVRSRYLAPGYWNRREASEAAFLADAADAERRIYRTGDRARMSDDGCLTLLGRMDFRVRVRGMSIETDVVEGALRLSPALADAVVACKRDAQGNDHLVAYVVPKHAGFNVTDLRRALTGALPPVMVPTVYVTLDAIPLSPNGKVDRKSLPDPGWTRPAMANEYIAPRDLLESQLVGIWERILPSHPVGVRDDFLDLGGDSLLATTMLLEIESAFEQSVPMSFFAEGASIEKLARLLQRASGMQSPVVRVREHGTRPPFFFLHGDLESGGFYSLRLGRLLSAEIPFFTMPPQGVDGSPAPDSFEESAAYHLAHLRRAQPRGPYFLGGECNGGHVAFEMARRLVAEGESVAALVIVRATAKNVGRLPFTRLLDALGWAPARQVEFWNKWNDFAMAWGLQPIGARPGYLLAKALRLRRLWNPPPSDPAAAAGEPIDDRERRRLRYLRLENGFVPRRFPGRISLLWPEQDKEPARVALSRWQRVSVATDLQVLPGDVTTCLTEHAPALASAIERALDVR